MSDNNPYRQPDANLEPEPSPGGGPAPENLNPWFSIWLRPRATIRSVIAPGPVPATLVVAGLYGVADGLGQGAAAGLLDVLEIGLFALMALLVGAGFVGGMVGMYIAGWLLTVTGRWLEGRAEPWQLRAAYAWSSIPAIWAALLLIPELAVFGDELFRKEMTETMADPQRAQWLYGFGLVETGLGLWALVVFLMCLSEVQGFSFWRALGNGLLASLLLVVPFALLGMLAAVLI
jgi:hypothetical protein